MELPAPAQDILLRETEHILADYLQLLDHRPAAPSTTLTTR
jgi:hypothetical protein